MHGIGGHVAGVTAGASHVGAHGASTQAPPPPPPRTSSTKPPAGAPSLAGLFTPDGQPITPGVIDSAPECSKPRRGLFGRRTLNPTSNSGQHARAVVELRRARPPRSLELRRARPPRSPPRSSDLHLCVPRAAGASESARARADAAEQLPFASVPFNATAHTTSPSGANLAALYTADAINSPDPLMRAQVRNLPTSRHISPYLHTSPHVSPCLSWLHCLP